MNTDAPLVEPDLSSESVTAKVSGAVLKRPLKLGWLGGFGIAFVLLTLFNLAVGWLLICGVGIWGINIPVAWGFAIVNFVWWIGIGHAGTSISAILLLLHQEWRTSINRLAEAMTIFAVSCAALFPLLHLGRPWVFYWLLPYPATTALWPQWRSPIVWVGIVPGWHSTIFPVYFVAGALFSGCAMVLTLLIPVRVAYGMEAFITIRHLENSAKVMLALGLMVAYGYISEIFMSYRSRPNCSAAVASASKFIVRFATVAPATATASSSSAVFPGRPRCRTSVCALVPRLFAFLPLWCKATLDRFILSTRSKIFDDAPDGCLKRWNLLLDCLPDAL